MRRKFAVVALAVTIASSGLGFFTNKEAAAVAEASFKDISGHWAQETIEWGIATGMIKGFPGGEFQPDGKVTESQFIAMLFRTFLDESISDSTSSWYAAYYKQAEEWNWPVQPSNANRMLNRGETARITAASQGHQLNVQEAVEFLLEQGFASGRVTADGRLDYAADAALTRAEAVQFIRNLASTGAHIRAADKPPAVEEVSPEALVSVHGAAVGDSVERLLAVMGEPARKDASEYGFQWYVYNQDYTDFAMFGVSGGEIAALYTNGKSVKLQGLASDSTAADVREAFGIPVSAILKGNTNFLINESEEYDTIETEKAYITVFYDLHDSGIISGVQVIEKQTELAMRSFYGKPSDDLRQSFERQSLDLVNAARVKRGLTALQWDGEASETAREHSADMAKNQFFGHSNLVGEDPGDRLLADNIQWRSYAENIAYGQTSAIFAHEGWMNSSGHRANILSKNESLGVGVAFAEGDIPFYTQNFLSR